MNFLDIGELPTSLRLCDSLQILDASNNALKTYGKFSLIYSMFLFNLMISLLLRLPEGFSQLRSLRVLSLNDVSLYELPADFGW